MAKLSDVPKVMRTVGLIQLMRRVVHEVSDDNLLVWAASLAYSWLFAVFPFLLFLLSILAYLPAGAKQSVNDQVFALVYASMPSPQAADTIWKNVSEILNHRRGSVLGIGLLLAIWAASSGMNMTISALDQCYELKRHRSIYRQRSLAVAMTLVVAVLLMLVLLLLPIGTIAILTLEKYGAGLISHRLLLTWRLARIPLALAALFIIVNTLYHYGPYIRQRFVLVTPGGVFCVLVWIGLGSLLRLYVVKFSNFNETYGTVGGAAIVLLVFYFDAVVLLVGEEINSEIDFAVLGVPRGSHDFIAPQPVASES
jgi:membrane protein